MPKAMRLFLLFLTLLLGSFAFGSSSHRSRSGPYCGDGHYTSSRGVHYDGGQGSSHKGGYYQHPKTSDQYGRHKKRAISEAAPQVLE
jgi:hypothetical protein